MIYNIAFILFKVLDKIGYFVIPKFYTTITKIKFKIFKISCSEGLSVNGRIILSIIPGKLSIGKNFKLNSRYKSNFVGLINPATFQIIPNGKIEIGDNCGFSSPVISSRKLVKIGNNVLMGGNVRIFDHDYHSLDYVHRRPGISEYPYVKSQEIIIEDDVFIGTNSIILKGVKIGARSIVGAGSVVTLKNIPPDSVVAGNPAVIVKSKNKIL